MNPNFKPHMITKALLKACEEQVQKYFGEREIGDTFDKCLICEGLESFRDCSHCPLGDGSDHCACIYDSTYINQPDRFSATPKQLLARGNRIIEILDEHGITIYDAEVKE